MHLLSKQFYFAWILILLSLRVNAQICHSFDPKATETYIAQEINQRHKLLSMDSIGLASTDNYDLTYHRMSVNLDPAIRYISGSVTSYFRPLPQLAQIAFDLTDSLTVDSVYYHGSRIQTITHSHNALTVYFSDTIRSFDSVTVFYSGIPPNTGFGSFATGFHNNTHPILWTLSEPYGSRDWFPGKMTLTDKVDSTDFYINVPVGNHAACNGLLMDSALTGNTVTYHWRHRYPIANYLIGIAVSDYTVLEDTVHTTYGDIYMLTYCFNEDSIYFADSKADVAKVLRLYSDLFGPYPFIKEKYGHEQFNWAGGMEHQTMSFIAGDYFELINHEMAHQWFGDKLTCGSWSDIWLNEGFAVYLSMLCFERLSPEWWMPSKMGTHNRVITGNDGSTLCSDTVSVKRIFEGALSYGKGAYMLHMLRWELSDSIFFAAMYAYANDTSAVYKFSKTEFLKKKMEEKSGKDLTVFFDQWYYGTGYPSYQLDWTQHGSSVSCRLSQTSKDTTVHFFTMHVPVRFYGNGIDTTISLDHRSSGQEYHFDLPFDIDSIHIDPDLWILSTANTIRRVPALGHDYFISLFPNPLSDMLTIWYDSQNMHHADYSIYDVSGQLMKEGPVMGAGDYYQTDLSMLSQGVYVVRVASEAGIYSQRIVKY